MTALRTAQLDLEPLSVSHADEMFALLADATLYRYIDHPPPPSLEHLRQVYTRQAVGQSADGREIWLNWVLRERATGLAVGTVQATVLGDGRAWVAYMLGRDFWGRGHARAATAAMVEHLLAHCHCHELMACVEQDNDRSLHLLACLGFAPAPADHPVRATLDATEQLCVLAAGAARPAGA